MKPGTKRLLRILSVTLSLLLLIAAPSAAAATSAVKTDRIAPNKPANLAASSVGQTTLKLQWSKSWDNVGVSSYPIFCNYAYLSYSTANTCTVSNLQPGTTYTFYVAAQDRAGNISGKSNVIKVTTLPKSSASPARTAPASGGATTAAPAKGKIIAGYYAGWAAYSGYTPNDVPVANLTHILYAFANIDSSYKIVLGDPDVDPGNLAELKAAKKRNGSLKTLISVGGWTWSGKFSDMAATTARRGVFADSVVSFLRKYGLDGVDLDWEYPVGGGLSTNSVRAADKTNFTVLLKLLREKLDAAGKTDGKRYLLSIAGGADTNYVKNVQLSAIAKYLDFATVMTYDMHGGYDKYTDHNAPLYPSASSPQRIWSADQAIKAWTGAGFPKSKLLMGMPFYGHLYSSVKGGGTGIHKAYSGMKTVSYDEIVSKYLPNKAYKRYYGATGRVPWLFNGSTFITYEDTQSIAEKSAYINSAGLAGVGIWEISQNADGTLLKKLKGSLK